MTREPVAIAPDLGVDVAVQLMGAHSCRRLPVVASTGRVVGIITLAEAQKALPGNQLDEQGFPRSGVPTVRDMMTDYVYSLAPTDTLSTAVRQMVNHKIGAMPVIEEYKLLGIVTESDIFRWLAREYDRAVGA
jgi:CBS domain-containing protein